MDAFLIQEMFESRSVGAVLANATILKQMPAIRYSILRVVCRFRALCDAWLTIVARSCFVAELLFVGEPSEHE